MQRTFCDCCGKETSRVNPGSEVREITAWVPYGSQAHEGRNITVSLRAACKGHPFGSHDLCMDCVLKAIDNALRPGLHGSCAPPP